MFHRLVLLLPLNSYLCASTFVTGSTNLPYPSRAMAIGKSNQTILLFGGYNVPRQFVEFYNTNFITHDQNYLSPSQQTWGFGQHYTQYNNELWIIRDDGDGFLKVNTETYYVESPSIAIPISVHDGGCLTSIANPEYLILVGGGDIKQNIILNTVQIHRISDGQWLSDVPSLIQARRDASCVVVNHTVYTIGGNGDPTPLNTIEILDTSNIDIISSSTWQYLSSNLSKELSGTRAIAYGTDIYVVGGWHSDTTYESDVHIIDTITGNCRIGDTLAFSVGYTAAIVVENILYSFGGLSGPSSTELYQYSILPKLNIATNRLYNVSNLSTKPTLYPSSNPTINPTINPTTNPTINRLTNNPIYATEDPMNQPSNNPISSSDVVTTIYRATTTHYVPTILPTVNILATYPSSSTAKIGYTVAVTYLSTSVSRLYITTQQDNSYVTAFVIIAVALCLMFSVGVFCYKGMQHNKAEPVSDDEIEEVSGDNNDNGIEDVNGKDMTHEDCTVNQGEKLTVEGERNHENVQQQLESQDNMKGTNDHDLHIRERDVVEVQYLKCVECGGGSRERMNEGNGVFVCMMCKGFADKPMLENEEIEGCKQTKQAVIEDDCNGSVDTVQLQKDVNSTTYHDSTVIGQV